MVMKMTLSIPRTISRAVSVKRLTHVSGEEKRSSMSGETTWSGGPDATSPGTLCYDAPAMIQLLDALPLWTFSLLTILISLGAFEIGYRFGRRRERESGGALGTFVGAGIGLLAFFLAFTFGFAGSRFEERRRLVLDEANALGTAYLRAQLVPDPHGSEIQRMLREYTDTRIEATQPGKLPAALARSEELHRRLWAEATALTESDPHSIAAGLLIQALNEVIDLHQKRVTAALRSRVPERVWDVLVLLTVLTMASMGVHAGQSKPERSPVVIFLALAFSAVILVIADLDRPQEGSLRVSQQALIDTRKSMDPH
jgi:hypothetical protein